MIHAETFVGSLAICLGVVFGVTAIVPRTPATALKLVQAIQTRFGAAVARAFVVFIATLLLLSGIMILRDMRPGFAVPMPGKSSTNRVSAGH